MIKDILTERHNIVRKVKQSPHCNDKNVFRKKIKNTSFFPDYSFTHGCVCLYGRYASVEVYKGAHVT